MNLTTKSVSRLPFCLLTISLYRYWLRAKLGPKQQFWTGPLCSIVLVLQWYVFSLDDTFVCLCTSFWLLGCHPMGKYWLNWKICYLGFLLFMVFDWENTPTSYLQPFMGIKAMNDISYKKNIWGWLFFPFKFKMDCRFPKLQRKMRNYSQKQMFRFYY